MIRRRGEERSLYSWLVLQEKFLRMWIEEALAAAPRETDFITKLERHHRWLAEQIDALAKQRAA